MDFNVANAMIIDTDNAEIIHHRDENTLCACTNFIFEAESGMN